MTRAATVNQTGISRKVNRPATSAQPDPDRPEVRVRDRAEGRRGARDAARRVTARPEDGAPRRRQLDPELVGEDIGVNGLREDDDRQRAQDRDVGGPLDAARHLAGDERGVLEADERKEHEGAHGHEAQERAALLRIGARLDDLLRRLAGDLDDVAQEIALRQERDDDHHQDDDDQREEAQDRERAIEEPGGQDGEQAREHDATVPLMNCESGVENQPAAPSQSPESGNAIDITDPARLNISSPRGMSTAAPATSPINERPGLQPGEQRREDPRRKDVVRARPRHRAAQVRVEDWRAARMRPRPRSPTMRTR